MQFSLKFLFVLITMVAVSITSFTIGYEMASVKYRPHRYRASPKKIPKGGWSSVTLPIVKPTNRADGESVQHPMG